MKKVKQLQDTPPGVGEFLHGHPPKRESEGERYWNSFRDYTDYKNAQSKTAYPNFFMKKKGMKVVMHLKKKKCLIYAIHPDSKRILIS